MSSHCFWTSVPQIKANFGKRPTHECLLYEGGHCTMPHPNLLWVFAPTPDQDPNMCPLLANPGGRANTLLDPNKVARLTLCGWVEVVPIDFLDVHSTKVSFPALHARNGPPHDQDVSPPWSKTFGFSYFFSFNFSAQFLSSNYIYDGTIWLLRYHSCASGNESLLQIFNLGSNFSESWLLLMESWSDSVLLSGKFANKIICFWKSSHKVGNKLFLHFIVRKQCISTK